jgi:hypothetical protein
MQPLTLLSRLGHLNNEITNIDEIAQFAEFLGKFGSFVEVLGFFIDNFQAIEGPLKAEFGTNDAHIIGHDLLDFLHVLGDEYHFLGIAGTGLIPIRDIGGERNYL